jgi:tripartite-type tricarboxylate transporter receptor subunit TctC
MSSYANDAYLMLVMADSPAKAVSDLKQGSPIRLTFGANNAASSNLIFAQIARDALGMNVNVVRGYTGASKLFLAMQNKEIDGQMVGLSSVVSGQRSLWERKAFRALAQFGRKTRHAQFTGIPTGRELTTDKAVLSLLDFAEAPFFMSLPFVAPPGVPADRAKALQEAFMAMCRDPDVVAEARKFGFDVSPIDAGEILQILKAMYATPPEVVARYKAISTDKSIKKK